ncbi:MAG: hypothetical protein ACOY93_12255 [Bacillota bacterium]
MPGKRTPADPLSINVNLHDADPNRAGVQNKEPKIGGQFRQGEAPPENAYREKPEQNN